MSTLLYFVSVRPAYVINFDAGESQRLPVILMIFRDTAHLRGIYKREYTSFTSARGYLTRLEQEDRMKLPELRRSLTALRVLENAPDSYCYYLNVIPPMDGGGPRNVAATGHPYFFNIGQIG